MTYAGSGRRTFNSWACAGATRRRRSFSLRAPPGLSPAQDSTNTVSLQSSGSAQTAIGLIDAAIEEVSGERGELGAVSNRLSSTMANLDQINVNLSASRGRIQDADFAAETANLAKNQILQQAATAMLAQANASQGTVLTLIQG